MNLLAVLECEKCGGELRAVVVGRIIAGREGNTMFECVGCKAPYLVTVTFRPAFMEFAPDAGGSHRSVAACGTEAGYEKHRRETGKVECEFCKAAHREGNARRAQRRPVKV